MNGQSLYSVQDLLDRYDLKSRQTLYNRLKAAGIELDSSGRVSYASQQQVDTLDDLQGHLAQGGNLSNYSPPATVQVLDSSQDSSGVPTVQLPLDSDKGGVQSALDKVLDLTATLLPPNTKWVKELAKELDPLWSHRLLTELEDFQVMVSTSQVKNLIEVNPHGKVFVRGSWKFTREGKIGREAAWRVSKIPFLVLVVVNLIF